MVLKSLRLESPTGDTSRKTGPFRPEDLEKKMVTDIFVSLNRNKKSVVIDLKSKDGEGKNFLESCRKSLTFWLKISGQV